MASQIDLGAVVPIGKGDWNSSTTYERANIVRHNSTAWVCKVATSTGVEPTENSSDWYLLVRDMSSVTSVNGERGDVIVNTVTTPNADDNSTKIANTEWVRRHISSIELPVATDTTTGIVKPGTGITVDAAGALNVTLNNTVTSTSTTQAATANAVKTAYDKAVEATSDVANVMSAVGQVQSEVEEVRTIAEESAARLDPRHLGTRSTAGVMTITGATVGRILVVGIKRKDAVADNQYAAFFMKSGTRFSYGTQNNATGGEMRIGKVSGSLSYPSTYIDIISSSTVIIDLKIITNSESPVSVYEV